MLLPEANSAGEGVMFEVARQSLASSNVLPGKTGKGPRSLGAQVAHTLRASETPLNIFTVCPTPNPFPHL